jgi:Hfq protein
LVIVAISDAFVEITVMALDSARRLFQVVSPTTDTCEENSCGSNECEDIRDRGAECCVNGIRLQGLIESFDQYGLALNGITQQFVFKQAIATIVATQDAQDPSATVAVQEKKTRGLSLSK